LRCVSGLGRGLYTRYIASPPSSKEPWRSPLGDARGEHKQSRGRGGSCARGLGWLRGPATASPPWVYRAPALRGTSPTTSSLLSRARVRGLRACAARELRAQHSTLDKLSGSRLAGLNSACRSTGRAAAVSAQRTRRSMWRLGVMPAALGRQHDEGAFYASSVWMTGCER